MLDHKAAKLIKRLGQRNDYPELYSEVEKALLRGTAKAFYHKNVGIVIMRPTFNKGKMGMLVWVAIGLCRNAIKKYLAFFEQMAKQTGGTFLEFRTKRKGFKRLAPIFNFTETHPVDGFFVFTKEV